MMHKVDIIVPLYNKEKTVGRTIESILCQTMSDFRLIIVDDGSTDGSVETVQRFTDSRILLVSQENQGPGAARNKGLELATAPYVAFLDADDQWYPFYLENSLKAIEKSGVAFVATTYDEWPEQIDMTEFWARRNVKQGTYRLEGGESPVDVLSMLFFFHVGNTVVQRAAAKKYGGFYSEDKCLLGEDTVFFAKLLFNERFEVLTVPAVRHNRQDSELSNTQNRPLDIFLQKPEIILDYCTGQAGPMASRVLAFHALRTAHFQARRGHKAEAVYLKNAFPEMKQFPFFYTRVCFEILTSRWFPYWIKLKRTIRALLTSR